MMQETNVHKEKVVNIFSWFLNKSFSGIIPQTYASIFEEKSNGEWQLHAQLVKGLTSSDLYTLACSNLFPEHADSWTDHESIVNKLLTRGFSLPDGCGSKRLLLHQLVAKEPFLLSIHVAVIEGIMWLYMTRLMDTQRVNRSLKRLVDWSATDRHNLIVSQPRVAIHLWLNVVTAVAVQKMKIRDTLNSLSSFNEPPALLNGTMSPTALLEFLSGSDVFLKKIAFWNRVALLIHFYYSEVVCRTPVSADGGGFILQFDEKTGALEPASTLRNLCLIKHWLATKTKDIYWPFSWPVTGSDGQLDLTRKPHEDLLRSLQAKEMSSIPRHLLASCCMLLAEIFHYFVSTEEADRRSWRDETSTSTSVAPSSGPRGSFRAGSQRTGASQDHLLPARTKPLKERLYEENPDSKAEECGEVPSSSYQTIKSSFGRSRQRPPVSNVDYDKEEPEQSSTNTGGASPSLREQFLRKKMLTPPSESSQKHPLSQTEVGVPNKTTWATKTPRRESDADANSSVASDDLHRTLEVTNLELSQLTDMKLKLAQKRHLIQEERRKSQEKETKQRENFAERTFVEMVNRRRMQSGRSETNVHSSTHQNNDSDSAEMVTIPQKGEFSRKNTSVDYRHSDIEDVEDRSEWPPFERKFRNSARRPSGNKLDQKSEGRPDAGDKGYDKSLSEITTNLVELQTEILRLSQQQQQLLSSSQKHFPEGVPYWMYPPAPVPPHLPPNHPAYYHFQAAASAGGYPPYGNPQYLSPSPSLPLALSPRSAEYEWQHKNQPFFEAPHSKREHDEKKINEKPIPSAVKSSKTPPKVSPDKEEPPTNSPRKEVKRAPPVKKVAPRETVKKSPVVNDPNDSTFFVDIVTEKSTKSSDKPDRHTAIPPKRFAPSRPAAPSLHATDSTAPQKEDFIRKENKDIPPEVKEGQSHQQGAENFFVVDFDEGEKREPLKPMPFKSRAPPRKVFNKDSATLQQTEKTSSDLPEEPSRLSKPMGNDQMIIPNKKATAFIIEDGVEEEAPVEDEIELKKRKMLEQRRLREEERLRKMEKIERQKNAQKEEKQQEQMLKEDKKAIEKLKREAIFQAFQYRKSVKEAEDQGWAIPPVPLALLNNPYAPPIPGVKELSKPSPKRQGMLPKRADSFDSEKLSANKSQRRKSTDQGLLKPSSLNTPPTRHPPQGPPVPNFSSLPLPSHPSDPHRRPHTSLSTSSVSPPSSIVSGCVFPPAVQEYHGPKLFVQPKSKSNLAVIQNAISHRCLAGVVNEMTKNQALEALSSAEGVHFMILLRGGCQYRASYSYNIETESLQRIHGNGPKVIRGEMVQRFFKYNSGIKNFTEIMSTKHLSPIIDAVMIYDQFWKNTTAPSRASSRSTFSAN